MNDYSDPDTWWEEYEICYRDRTWSDRRYRVQIEALSRLGLSGPLIDIGCGLGFLVECARRNGIASIGLEASEKALELARKRHPDADLRHWNSGNPLPLDDASAGGVVLVEFIDHISRPHNVALFEEVRRVLRPGGLLQVQSPSRFNRFDDDKGHIDFFSPSEFRRFVAEHGFQVLSQPWTPQPFLGGSGTGRRLMKLATLLVRPERWAARIDLVARRQ